jgi:hypothetical protein
MPLKTTRQENPDGSVTLRMEYVDDPIRPPWRAGADKKKRRQMQQWVNTKLDILTRMTGDEFLYFWSLKNLDAMALEFAEQGDIEPLRELNPHLARFLHLPKLKRGEHFIDPARIRLKRARDDVRRIRAIWREHYGKTNRPIGELTAEEIAADRWSLSCWRLTPDEVSRCRLARVPVRFKK